MSLDMDNPENPSILLARTILESLIEQGVRHVAYAPGSRDAPFGYALAGLERQGLVSAATFSDERGAGFWAVGAARALGEPVAVITTSGTAVAELHPALEEAWFQSLPVIAVTADRPHELRGVGASQTTHQTGIFGGSVVASSELPAEMAYDAAALARVRGRVRRTVASARGFLGRSGPVHLNVAFREPLVPRQGGAPARHEAPQEQTAGVRIASSGARHLAWDAVVDGRLRTVVVAGDGASCEVATAAARRGIPIVAEPSSNVTELDTWIPYQQWLVPELLSRVEQVVVTGRPTLSRPITTLLAQPGVRTVVVATHPEWVDVHESADVVVAGLEDEVSSGALGTPTNGWLEVWRGAAGAVDRMLGESAQAGPAPGVLTLLSACRAIWRASESALLWLGASNTVRGFDLVANRPGRGGVHSNRGLAGIDGTVAAALGMAMAADQPVRAVMGDMTFAYDLSTLAQRPEAPGARQPDLQVIVLDDCGGAIFASLEHGGAAPDVYERFFAVAPQLDPVAAARACGWEARAVTNLDGLREALAAPVVGRSLIHVPIPRPSTLLGAVGAAAAAAIAGVHEAPR